MNVTNSNRESIRGVVGLRRCLELQERANHLLNLILFGAAVACHSALDFQRRILEDRQIRFRCGEHRNAPDVAQRQCALNIGGVKQTLEGCGFGVQIANDVDNGIVDRSKASRQRIRGFRSDGAAADEKTFGAIVIDDAVTGNSGSAIDAENPHHFLSVGHSVPATPYRACASRGQARVGTRPSADFWICILAGSPTRYETASASSDSSISKFAYTCWTSSCSSRASMSFTTCCAVLPSTFT